jgi:DNA invertase Pin-like site-specific DNA recombinase
MWAATAGQADGLVCAKLDRLGRDVGDFADLLKLSTKERWALRLLDLDIDTSTSMGEAAAFSSRHSPQAERKRIGERTREGLAVKRGQGVKLGRPPAVEPKTVAKIKRQRKAGKSLRWIADRLNATGTPTAHGGSEWRASSVRAVLNRVDQRRRYRRRFSGPPAPGIRARSDFADYAKQLVALGADQNLD